MKITIYGAGAFGSALGDVLSENGHEIKYYDPAKYPDEGLSESIEYAEVNILAVPSHAAPKLLLFLPHQKPLICASKGFLSLASFLPFGNNLSVISGGAFAADLMNKKPSTLTATSDLAEKLFKTSWLTLDRSTDNLGVMLCGSFKNVYAIGAGYWHLQYGTPDFDDYINTALGEMRTILSANGCNPNTSNLSCGLNDLVITCASTASRNYDFGTKLKKDPTLGVKALKGTVRTNTTEGVSTIAQIPTTKSFIKPDGVPILDRIITLVTKPVMPDPSTQQTQAKPATAPVAPATPNATPAAPAPSTTPAQAAPVTPAAPAPTTPTQAASSAPVTPTPAAPTAPTATTQPTPPATPAA